MAEEETIIKLLNSGKFLYFRLEDSVYSLSKANDKECQLSFWTSDGWVGNNIKNNTAIDLIKTNYITSSLQLVYLWILENNPDERH